MSGKKVKFIDVGEGDCILLQPQGKWSLNSTDIYVDTGNGNKDIAKVSHSKKINIVLTHNHSDHVNGIQYLLSDMTKNIQNIYLPFYANEIDMIAQSIIKLKGFQYSEAAHEIYRFFQDFHKCYIGLKNKLTPIQAMTKITFVSQNYHFDDCLECLNPSMCFDEIQWASNIDVNSFFYDIDRIFVKDFAAKFKRYFVHYRGTHDSEHAYNETNRFIENLNDSWIEDSEDNAERQEARTSFMLSFFASNMLLFSSFNASPNLEIAKQIKKNFQKVSHDVCIVLMANLEGQKILLTSDASVCVFERLIREKISIQADYMKASHHGSINNINRSILEAVQPKAIIISHGNRTFGRAKDSHPHIETLKLLSSMKIRILSTRDITKENTIVFSKKSQESYLLNNPIIEIE